jgi:hypothetical protein
MKRLALLMLLVLPIFGLEPPKPFKGVGTNMSLGFSQMDIKIIDGWNIDTTDLSIGKEANFKIVPSQSGWGCQVHINAFNDDYEANAEVNRLKSTFQGTFYMPDGFEAKVKESRYACRQQGSHVIQIWYPLPHKRDFSENVWNAIKNGVSLVEKNQQKEPVQWVAVTEHPGEGLVCHHPNNKLHVLYKKSFTDRASPNHDANKKYMLSFSDRISSGYFYVKWDQESLSTKEPYDNHLGEIRSDILAIEPDQKFEDSVNYDLEYGAGFQKGSPYSILTVYGDGFLFGFAVKPIMTFRSLDWMDFIKKVAWWQDDETTK